MGLANNLNRFEWENEIPFSTEQVKRTLHAMIGESMTVNGLLTLDADKLHWDLNCVNPENNDTFGSYSFGQINSKFSITVKSVDENNSGLRITVVERQGAFITGNQAYLQSECDKFIKAFSFYLEHPDVVDNWYNVIKPHLDEVEKKATEAANSGPGCGTIATIIVVLGVGLGLLLAWLL